MDYQRTRRRQPRRQAGVKLNYRMALCAAVAVSLLLAVLFLVLLLGQRGKSKTLDAQLKELTAQAQTLEGEKAQLQQTLDGLYASAIAALPDPTTANTQSLPDLIPQLTESIYIVRLSGGSYQYLKIPAGILTDRLLVFRDAEGYTASAETAAAEWDLWVLYADRVIGMQTGGGDYGFVSTDRTAAGTAYTLPGGFNNFVTSLIA